MLESTHFHSQGNSQMRPILLSLTIMTLGSHLYADTVTFFAGSITGTLIANLSPLAITGVDLRGPAFLTVSNPNPIGNVGLTDAGVPAPDNGLFALGSSLGQIVLVTFGAPFTQFHGSDIVIPAFG